MVYEYVSKPCERCGNMMINVARTRRFCDKCTQAKNRDKARARSLSKGMIPLGERECPVCHKKFTQKSGRQKFCSKECAKVAEGRMPKHERYVSDDDDETYVSPLRRKPKINADQVTAAANAEGLSYGQYSLQHQLYADVIERSHTK